MNHKNITQSVKTRLLNIARKRNENFTNLLIRYGLERLLYRLSRSDYTEKFVLKGATLFNYWHGQPHRATLDADFAIRNKITIKEAEEIIKKICRIDVEDDGLLFLAETVAATDMREENACQGIRVKLKAKLGKAVISIQIDMGFSDMIIPPPEEIEYPTLLDFPSPKLLAYTPETSIAEKIQVILEKGMVNSRMKDYYDIWFLIVEFEFSGIKMKKALEATLLKRQTEVPSMIPTGLSDEFVRDELKQSQWKGFLSRIGLNNGGMELEKVVAAINRFIMPVIKSINDREEFNRHWQNSKGWG